MATSFPTRRSVGKSIAPESPEYCRFVTIAALARGERVDPVSYYFRTLPRFDTGHPKYAFLNRLLAVSMGDRRPDGPIYSIEEIS